MDVPIPCRITQPLSKQLPRHGEFPWAGIVNVPSRYLQRCFTAPTYHGNRRGSKYAMRGATSHVNRVHIGSLDHHLFLTNFGAYNTILSVRECQVFTLMVEFALNI